MVVVGTIGGFIRPQQVDYWGGGGGERRGRRQLWNVIKKMSHNLQNQSELYFVLETIELNFQKKKPKLLNDDDTNTEIRQQKYGR